MTAIVSEYESRLESINKMISRIADRSTPLLKRHLDLSNPVTAIKHEWVDKVLKGLMDTLKSAVSSSTATVITLNGGTNSPKRIIDGITVLLIGAERLLVNSTITVVTNAASYHVSRGHRSTTASTYAVGKQAKILNSRQEGFTAGRDDSQKGVRQFNYTMIMERQLVLSGSSQAVDTVQKENKMDQQAKEQTPELLKELEGHFLYSDRYADADLDDRSAGGFYWHATNRGAVAAADQDRGGAAIDRQLIDGVIEEYIKKGGDPGQLVALTSVRQQRKINDLKESLVVTGGMSMEKENLNFFVNRYDFGSKAQVEIQFSTDVMDDQIFFYQKDKVKVKPLQGRAWKREPLAKTGDTDREMVVGEYTFEFENSRELLYFYNNLATTV